MFAKESIAPDMEVRGVNSPLTSYYLKINGSYPFNKQFDKNVKRILSKANREKNVVISCIVEPNLFITKQQLSWFDYIHSVCVESDFPVTKIIFLTCNIYATESYNKWCSYNNVSNRMLVVSQTKHYWINRLIKHNYHHLNDTAPTKHLSCFIGRPRLQKNYIVKWFIEKIQDTGYEEKMLCTFLYGNFISSDQWFSNNIEKISLLPRRIEDNSSDHTRAWLDGDPAKFNSAFALSLVDFVVDYVEFEDFADYNDYIAFKKMHTWWKEDSLSEKIFRCVLLKKPFIRLGMPQSLKKFREWGFKTFDGVLFDETYDDIDDFPKRLSNILTQIDQLLQMPFEDLKKKVYSDEVQEIIEHNYKLAYEIYEKNEGILNV